jgi:hypothetical protein
MRAGSAKRRPSNSLRRECGREQREREKGVAEVTPELRAAGLDLAEQAASEHGANCTWTE